MHRHGGMVDKFMGDGMLAVFGAPEPLANHADSGLRAAAAIVAAMETLNGKRAESGQAPVRVGVGIHSGLVVTGCLGSGARLEFTVIGDTVNTAARLEALTKERGVEILASDETMRRATIGAELTIDGLRFAVETVGETAIRGRRESLGLHALIRTESGPRLSSTR